MRHVVDRENPRVLHVMGDRLEDLLAGVYQHIVSIPLYPTNRKEFLQKGDNGAWMKKQSQ